MCCLTFGSEKRTIIDKFRVLWHINSMYTDIKMCFSFISLYFHIHFMVNILPHLRSNFRCFMTNELLKKDNIKLRTKHLFIICITTIFIMFNELFFKRIKDCVILCHLSGATFFCPWVIEGYVLNLIYMLI